MLLGKRAREPGLMQTTLPPMTFAQWQRSMCNQWFSTNTHFLTHIVQRPLKMPDHIPDTLTTRAIAVFCRYGVATTYDKCPVAKCCGDI
eukprot:3864050-Karenia_brevis.AAC.1